MIPATLGRELPGYRRKDAVDRRASAALLRGEGSVEESGSLSKPTEGLLMIFQSLLLDSLDLLPARLVLWQRSDNQSFPIGADIQIRLNGDAEEIENRLVDDEPGTVSDRLKSLRHNIVNRTL